MQGSDHDEVPGDLEPIVSRLRAERADVSPLELDRIKQRALSRSTTRFGRRTYMKSRIAAILTVLGLVGGTGGAIAIASGGGSSSGSGNCAAYGQYCPPMRHCGPHRHHHHHHHPGPPWWYLWWLQHHHQMPPWWWWYYWNSHHRYPPPSWPG